MMKRLLLLATFSLALGLPATARAGALEALQQFLDGTKSFRAEFSQSVSARSGRKPQQSSGVVAFQKPGKFRWEIKTPYAQLMVGDGSKVWIYDPELEQATVKKMDAALGATPVALLAGSGDLSRNFLLSDSGEEGGLQWAEARPKHQEAGFERVRLGFSARGELQAMELFDNFGQTTLLRFHRQERNPGFSAGFFQFTPPKGTDVIGE